jgi:LmbE family N-acetylglucosaminyl deacetylase
VFYYYCSHLRKVPDPSFIMDISGFEERKARAIGAYKSQFAQNPLNMQVPEWIAAADRYFGSRIGTGAGEPFWCKEPLGLTGLDSVPF